MRGRSAPVVTRLRLRVRAAVTLVALVVTLAFLGVMRVDPAPGRFLGLAVLGLLVAVLVWELLPDRGTPWPVTLQTDDDTRSLEAGVAAWVRALDDHRTTATPDERLRERLRRTVADVVLVRRGERLEDLDPQVRREVLGAALDDLLHGPVRRIRTDDLLQHLERIEHL